MNTEAAAAATDTAAPLHVGPWVTVWEQEEIVASIAHDKAHRVMRRVVSDNKESGVVNPSAKREELFYALCGTTRRGRYYALAAGTEVTCGRCLKKK